MPGAESPKMTRCIEKIKETGIPVGSAIAICRSSVKTSEELFSQEQEGKIWFDGLPSEQKLGMKSFIDALLDSEVKFSHADFHFHESVIYSLDDHDEIIQQLRELDGVKEWLEESKKKGYITLAARMLVPGVFKGITYNANVLEEGAPTWTGQYLHIDHKTKEVMARHGKIFRGVGINGAIYGLFDLRTIELINHYNLGLLNTVSVSMRVGHKNGIAQSIIGREMSFVDFPACKEAQGCGVITRLSLDEIDTDSNGDSTMADEKKGQGDDSDKSNQDCPDGKIWNAEKGACVPVSTAEGDCPDGQVWDAEKGECVAAEANQDCPDGKVWDAEKGECVAAQQDGTCPAGMVWDAGTGKCVPSPPPPPAVPSESANSATGKELSLLQARFAEQEKTIQSLLSDVGRLKVPIAERLHELTDEKLDELMKLPAHMLDEKLRTAELVAKGAEASKGGQRPVFFAEPGPEARLDPTATVASLEKDVNLDDLVKNANVVYGTDQ